jgi:phage terminase small subunit
MHIAVPTKSGLPPREHNFCHFLAADPIMDVGSAYLKVNPDMQKRNAKVAGTRFLQDPNVVDYLGVLLEERKKRLEMDEDWVVMQLRNVYDRCMQNEPVYGPGSAVLDDEGNETGETVPLYYKFDANGSTKALELIGKHMKMFSDKTSAGTANFAININLGASAEGEQKPVIEGEFKRVGAN